MSIFDEVSKFVAQHGDATLGPNETNIEQGDFEFSNILLGESNIKEYIAVNTTSGVVKVTKVGNEVKGDNFLEGNMNQEKWSDFFQLLIGKDPLTI